MLEGTSNQKEKFIVHYGQEQQEAFETLQKLFTESPILAYADFNPILYSILMLVGSGQWLFSKKGRKESL